MQDVADPPVIRSVLPTDVEAIARIYVESANVGFGDLDPKRVLDSERVERWRSDLAAPLPYRWWVATRNGVIVGFAGIGPSRDPIDPDLGELDTKPVLRTRVEWYSALVVKHPKAAARLVHINAP